MRKKVIVVTGASGGLGRVVVNNLLKNGYVVYACARKSSKEHPGNPAFKPIYLDLTSSRAILDCTSTILENEQSIDAIIHCARVAYITPQEEHTHEEISETFQVNVFGALEINKQLLPRMRNQNSGKIIFISSIRAVEPHVYLGSYSASKAALESFAFDLAVSLKPWNIDVCVLQPGPVDTNMQIKFKQTKNSAYPPLPPLQLNWQDPEEISLQIVALLNEKNPPFSIQPSQHAKQVVEKHLVDGSRKQWLKEQEELFRVKN